MDLNAFILIFWQECLSLQVWKIVYPKGGLPQDVPKRDPVPWVHQRHTQRKRLKFVIRSVCSLGFPRYWKKTRPGKLWLNPASLSLRSLDLTSSWKADRISYSYRSKKLVMFNLWVQTPRHTQKLNDLLQTRELPGNALVNFKLANIHGKWQHTELQWNIEIALLPKRNVFPTLPWHHGLSSGLPYFLTKVSSFQVRYIFAK